MDSLVRREERGLLPLMRAMDRMLDEMFVPSSLFGWGRVGPAVDMYETDDAYVVKASLPGIKPEDIEITVVGDTVTIKGEVKAEEHEEKRNYIYRERRTGRFMRSLTLPGVVTEDAKAEFDNGVLTLTLPKPEERKAKRIKVKAKES